VTLSLHIDTLTRPKLIPLRSTRLAVDMPKLMASGQLKSNPLLHREGGLEKVNEGMNFQKEGKVS